MISPITARLRALLVVLISLPTSVLPKAMGGTVTAAAAAWLKLLFSTALALKVERWVPVKPGKLVKSVCAVLVMI